MLRQSQRQNMTQLVFLGRKQLDTRSVGAKPNCHVLSLHCLSCVMCIGWLLIRRQMPARQLWASSDSRRVWGECLPTEICLENHAGKKRSNWKTWRERKWEMSLSVFEELSCLLMPRALRSTHSLCHWLTPGRQRGCLCLFLLVCRKEQSLTVLLYMTNTARIYSKRCVFSLKKKKGT